MTLADLLRQEGREEGRKEGIKKSIESVVEKPIIKGLTTEDIAEITGLNREQIEEIRKRMLV